MIKPRPIRLGDTIGVIAPASPASREEVDRAKEGLENLGFQVVMGRSCYHQHGYLAGKDQIRAMDINHMFADNHIDGIINLRGGYGTPRILSMLDYPMIRKHPKVFVGYSDITALHIALNKLCNMVTFHGPMAGVEIMKDLDAYTKHHLLAQISGQIESINNPEGMPLQILEGGMAEGTIIGGNLTLIVSTLGTPYEIDTKDKILFIEEVGERPYKVDRLLTHLNNAGKLEDASGILIGDFKGCDPLDDEESLSLMEVFEEIILPLKKPTLYQLQAGHCTPNITLPLGVQVQMDANRGMIRMMERGTK